MKYNEEKIMKKMVFAIILACLQCLLTIFKGIIISHTGDTGKIICNIITITILVLLMGVVGIVATAVVELTNSTQKRTYTTYAPETDQTFIFEETDYKEITHIECVGWYYGEPDESATIQFRGKLYAEIDR